MDGIRRIVILGAGGRDFHVFNVLFRHDPGCRVVAFTAAQIPGIDRRTYPASLAGPLYPEGIPIAPEAELAEVLRSRRVDEVILAYSDLSHNQVMHLASRALAEGCDFRLLSPASTALRSSKPVLAVCATRTGAGKSQTSRYVATLLREAGLRPALVRHPMAYGDLAAMRSQRFTSLREIDEANPSIEEREEYEEPVRQGIVVYAGVDYSEVLASAEADADVIVWDGGNNDSPFFHADVQITVTDARRPGHESTYHPGEVNVRMADVVVINKVDSAEAEVVAEIRHAISSMNPSAAVVTTSSPVSIDTGPDLAGVGVVVVEDGPTLTHGGMADGAGTVAARASGARIIDPRPAAVGSIRRAYGDFAQLGPVVPALGYSPEQISDLEATIRRSGCEAVVSGTPFDLARLVSLDVPVRRVRYGLADAGSPTLGEVLRARIDAWVSRLGDQCG
ncbi:MAG TPA: GTP-binding protein [Acidimicrobiales bacterium]|nr:GTP-binding protein [Acidimicrobiales bacterium]